MNFKKCLATYFQAFGYQPNQDPYYFDSSVDLFIF